MRFIYKILLGLVIFNAMLVLLVSLFPTATPVEALDVETDPTISGYENVEDMESLVLGMFANTTTLMIIGAVVAASGVIGFVFGGGKNVPIAIGVGIFIAIISSLWYSTSAVIMNIDPTDSPIITGIITIITICIGIILVFTVAEFFAGQSGVDT